MILKEKNWKKLLFEISEEDHEKEHKKIPQRRQC